MRVFVVVARGGLVLPFLLAVFIWVTSYQAISAAEGPQCMRHQLTRGISTPLFFAGVSLAGIFWLAQVTYMAWGRSERTRRDFENPGTLLLRFGSTRVTREAAGRYAALFVVLWVLSFFANFSFAERGKILADCPLA